ncbi:BA5345 family protein [Bacillus cabrialesii]|uniref:hypothetical protein n=1 Tax=Bacillus cabrialesii TaxID=2487276 RepID=UPI0028F9A375|nr:hypothetical protein [Bacillus cabrialesii]MDU0153584.1 hypothetical protein [Bacillus cabrialesii]
MKNLNFDTKYLIRWGIPGWVFIMLISLPILFLYHDELLKFKIDISKTLGLFVSLAFFGVTIGYIMQQIHFSNRWSKNKQIIDEAARMINAVEEHVKGVSLYEWGEDHHQDYYVFEYVWHRELLKLKDAQRDYIADRYRHILSTIHSLGTLRVSLVISIVVNFVTLIKYNFDSYFNPTLNPNMYIFNFVIFIIYFGLIGWLFKVVSKGYEHYSANLNAFQGYFLNELINWGTFKENKQQEEKDDEDEIEPSY